MHTRDATQNVTRMTSAAGGIGQTSETEEGVRNVGVARLCPNLRL